MADKDVKNVADNKSIFINVKPERMEQFTARNGNEMVALRKLHLNAPDANIPDGYYDVYVGKKDCMPKKDAEKNPIPDTFSGVVRLAWQPDYQITIRPESTKLTKEDGTVEWQKHDSFQVPASALKDAYDATKPQRKVPEVAAEAEAPQVEQEVGG